MKAIIAALALTAALSAGAQDVVTIEFNNGNTQTINVADIKEMRFEQKSTIAGEYTGEISVVVGGQFTYKTTITGTVSENPDGTINFTYPEYVLTGTVMGDLTLGTVTIPDIAYDEAKGAYFRDYSADGIKQHFTAVSGGNTSMNNDYVLGTGSTITLKFDGNSVSIQNPFKLGAMPFPLVATFTGTK